MKGTRLAGYEIIDKLGEGGMGEVWRARDEQLGRTVAIKVLPADLSGDPDRRARFEHEARALAALNHPNIVSVFGAGEYEGRSFIVSELVDGESLRAVIDRGRLPFRKVVDIAVQISEGMAAAHAAGIVHRDLKPENIMLTPEGRVKVLDFGLAKKTARAASDATATALSQPGLVMGTAGYMSPEQVRGEVVDSRSDIFSFGVVLYELLTGKRAFTGASAVDTMHAVLHEDPPETGASDPALNTIIRRCLEKRPDQRFQSAADLAFALRAISPTAVSSSLPAAVALRKRSWHWPLLALVGACVVFAAGYYLRDRSANSAPPAFQRITFRTGLVTNARFVPGSHNVVYSAKWEMGPSRIYLATPGTPESRDLQMPEDSVVSSVSSKEDILFLTGPFSVNGTGALSRGSVSGGRMRPSFEDVLIADWTADATSTAVLRLVNGVNRLEYPVGSVVWNSVEAPPLSFRISPDGRHLAVAHFYRGSSVAITVVDSQNPKAPGKFLAVVSDQSPNRVDAVLSWSPDGKEVLFRSFDPKEWGTIYALDMKGRRRIVMRAPGHLTLYDVASDGRMLVRTDNRQVGILGVAPGQTTETDLSCLDASDLVGISEDGTVIAASVSGESGGPKGSIYLRKTDGSPPVRLGDGTAVALSPDGRWVSGLTSVDSATRRYALLPAGAGEERVVSIPTLKGFNVVFGWRPDGETLLVFGPGKKQNYQSFKWNPRSGELQPIGPEGQADMLPAASPDGRRIMTKGPDGGWWVYPVDGGAGLAVKSISQHETPVGWRSDNRSIYFTTHHNENRMLPVSILDLESGVKKPWKEIHPSRPVEQALNLQITPDGRAYAYNFMVKTSDLYVASLDGAKP